MLNIKVFKFVVSNCSTDASEKDKDTAWYNKNVIKIQSEKKIENEINAFIKDKDVVDIKINTVDSKYHNNGCNNTIWMMYTIIYKIDQ